MGGGVKTNKYTERAYCKVMSGSIQLILSENMHDMVRYLYMYNVRQTSSIQNSTCSVVHVHT